MEKRILIDTTHPEESRVAIVDGHKLEEFDFDSSGKKTIKGNIYLAKVVRVEPSLQAAFVDYGADRHGFLAFNEIHPDYFRIPVSDKQEEVDVDEKKEAKKKPTKKASEEETEESTEDSDPEEKTKSRFVPLHRRYKIQEVIKNNQVMLLQALKEERGTKGAAFSTFVSLAGRYCVVMPNAIRGSGISRKITDMDDRKRLKSIVDELKLPDTIGVIVRTAGKKRTKPEIKRDLDYLLKLWNEIREQTLSSNAPALIYEEADIIRRSIRDLYNNDIKEILVEGEDGYTRAKEFAKKIIPSNAKKVVKYQDMKAPLFQQYKIETQIHDMLNPVIHLSSGGYLIIDTTEALVAIDVNSGRATRERHIEETAFNTNLEAAKEIARQLRLRDLAGLIVIDFIDMDEGSHIGKVERTFREAMRHDRARIQIGQISSFGLLEMSRQRLRPSIMEMHSSPCPSCRGTGLIRSVESSAVQILRTLEEEALKGKSKELSVKMPVDVVLYILNYKRQALADIEQRHSLKISIMHHDSFVTPDFLIESEEMGIILDTREQTLPESSKKLAEKGSTKSQGRKRSRRGRRTRPHTDTKTEAETSDTSAQPTQEKAEASEKSAQTPQTERSSPRRANLYPRRRHRTGKKPEGEQPKDSGANQEVKGSPFTVSDFEGDTIVPLVAESQKNAPRKESSDSEAKKTPSKSSSRSTARKQPVKSSETTGQEAESKPRGKSSPKKSKESSTKDEKVPYAAATSDSDVNVSSGGDGGDDRKGWWQRLLD